MTFVVVCRRYRQPEDLISADASGYAIRVAYQQPIQAKLNAEEPKEALANTFEDALVYENIDLFKSLQGSGLIGRFREALKDSTDLVVLAVNAAAALAKGGKAEFAMELSVSLFSLIDLISEASIASRARLAAPTNSRSTHAWGEVVASLLLGFMKISISLSEK